MYDLKTILLAKRIRRKLDVTRLSVADIALLEIIKNASDSNPVRDATISNGIAYFDRVSVSQPLVSLKLNIPVTQTGSGTPSPDNIRDIVGVSGVNVTRTGVNLWDEEWEVYNNTYIISKNYISVVGGETYYWNCPVDPSNGLRYYDVNKNLIKTDYSVPSSKLIVMPSNCRYIMFRLSSSYGTTYNHDISINYPSTDTSYHAYNGNTYPITFGQTVYSAILDVLTGKLYLTHEIKTIDENSGIDMTSVTSIFYWNDFFDIANDTESVNCNCYFKDTNRANPNNVSGSNQDLTFCCRTSAPTLYIKDTRFTTIEDYKTWLSTNPVKIAVKLAEPIEIDITPTQITTLIGENVIFADVADVTECKYTRK